MAQASEQLRSSRGSDGDEKEAQGAFQTDFSVTNRLLPSYNSSGGATTSTSNLTLPFKPGSYSANQPNSTSALQAGWQGYLPPDQGIRVYPQWKFCTMGAEEQSNSSCVQSDQEQISPGIYHQQGWKPCVIHGSEAALKKEQLAADEEGCEEESDAESSSHSHSSNGDMDGIEEPKKPKRTRTAYSNSQLDQLELAFSRSHYPDVFTREDLSNKLNIKEDRIQVWFQNRRARYRKQERTGSVSLRSKYRQKRLQRLQQSHAAAAAMSYYPACGGAPSGGMIASPQPAVSPYMSGFHFPPNYAVGGISPSGTKGSAPFSANYVAMNLNPNSAGLGPNMGSAYSTIPSGSLIAPVSQQK